MLRGTDNFYFILITFYEYVNIKKTQRFLFLTLDLCDSDVKEEKLNYFTVSMLKEICTFLELPFKSRDSKAVLMSITKEVTYECQCSVEG